MSEQVRWIRLVTHVLAQYLPTSLLLVSSILSNAGEYKIKDVWEDLEDLKCQPGIDIHIAAAAKHLQDLAGLI